MAQRIFLYPKDLVILTGYTYQGAWKLYRTLLDSLGKSKGMKITIGEYCKINEIEEKEVRKSLQLD